MQWQLLFILLLVVGSAGPTALAADTDFTALRTQIETSRQQGNLDLADKLTADYLAMATKQADPQQQALAYHQMGNNAMERNNYPVARQQLERAISLLQPNGQTAELASALRRLGMVYRYQSDYATALQYMYQAMQINQTLQDESQIASTYSSIGTILEKMGQYEDALQAHQQSFALHFKLGNQSSLASAIYNLGDLHRVLGDKDKALAYFLQTLQLDLASGDKLNIAYSHNKLGYLYSELGEFDKAAEHTQQAMLLFEQIGAPRDTDWGRTVVAKLAMEQGDYPKAQQLLDGVIERAKTSSYKSLLVDAYKMAAELALRQNDAQAVLRYTTAGIEQAQQNNERADEALLLHMQVQAYIQLDAVREALAGLLRQKQLDDEIFNSKRAATIAAIQAQTDFTRQQYQIDLLQNEQQLQQAQLEQQHLIRNFWISGLVAAFILMISLYRRYVQRQQNRRLEQKVDARTQQLKQKNAELAQAYQQLEIISLTDKLTGLHNRHFLESHINTELEQCRRMQHGSGSTAAAANSELALFIIDLDHFKLLNDNHGHSAGDEVLKHLRHIMQQVFRQSDYLVRWGGEEFVAVARNINRDEVSHLAQRFVNAVQHTPIRITGDEPLHITCSVGYACYPLPLGEPAMHWQRLLKLADLCLYAAKYSGRNGWVGLDNCTADLPLSQAGINAAQMQAWHQQGMLQLQHSFNGAVNWQA